MQKFIFLNTYLLFSQLSIFFRRFSYRVRKTIQTKLKRRRIKVISSGVWWS